MLDLVRCIRKESPKVRGMGVLGVKGRKIVEAHSRESCVSVNSRLNQSLL